MAEGTFRPERRAIDPNSAANQEHLNRMAQIRAAAGESDEGASIQDVDEPLDATPRQMPSTPDGAGLQIKGRIPEAFLRATQQVQKESGMMNTRGPQKRPNAPSPTAKFKDASLNTDDKLAQMLANLQNKSALFETIELPSKGKFYDGTNGPTDGVISVRPMTGEEEQILATPRFVKRGQAINMIFNKCIQGGVNSENLLAQDRTYLLIYLRGISYTPEYDVDVKCPNCERKFSTTIDLNALNFDPCPDDFDQESLQGTLPTSGYSFRYRLATGNDEQRVQEYRDRRMKAFDLTGQADDTLLYRTALLVEDIEGIADKASIQTLLQKLPVNDVAYLRSVVNEPPFGVDTNVEIPCPGCQQDFEIELPMEANFFFPRARKKTQNTTQA